MKLSNGSFALLNNEAPRTGIVITKIDRCVQTTEITINKSGDNLLLCEVRVLGGESLVLEKGHNKHVVRNYISTITSVYQSEFAYI